MKIVVKVSAHLPFVRSAYIPRKPVKVYLVIVTFWLIYYYLHIVYNKR